MTPHSDVQRWKKQCCCNDPNPFRVDRDEDFPRSRSTSLVCLCPLVSYLSVSFLSASLPRRFVSLATSYLPVSFSSPSGEILLHACTSSVVSRAHYAVQCNPGMHCGSVSADIPATLSSTTRGLFCARWYLSYPASFPGDIPTRCVARIITARQYHRSSDHIGDNIKKVLIHHENEQLLVKTCQYFEEIRLEIDWFEKSNSVYKRNLSLLYAYCYKSFFQWENYSRLKLGFSFCQNVATVSRKICSAALFFATRIDAKIGEGREGNGGRSGGAFCDRWQKCRNIRKGKVHLYPRWRRSLSRTLYRKREESVINARCTTVSLVSPRHKGIDVIRRKPWCAEDLHK